MTIRTSLNGALQIIRATGWTPGAILDIGVAMGTEGLYTVWPGAPIVLIDPVAENLIYMEQIKKQFSNVQIFNVGASDRCDQIVGCVEHDTGYAMLGRNRSKAGWEMRTFDVLTMDEIVRRANVNSPFLYKLDTDEHEANVLRGSTSVLANTDVCVIEAKMFNGPKNKITPAAIIKTLDAAGFSLTDIAQIARNTNGVTGYLDLVFVRNNSILFSDLLRASAKSVDDIRAERLAQRLNAKENPT